MMTCKVYPVCSMIAELCLVIPAMTLGLVSTSSFFFLTEKTLKATMQRLQCRSVKQMQKAKLSDWGICVWLSTY